MTRAKVTPVTERHPSISSHSSGICASFSWGGIGTVTAPVCPSHCASRVAEWECNCSLLRLQWPFYLFYIPALSQKEQNSEVVS